VWKQKESVEALLRSLFLVLMDNAVAEYSFVTAFFNFETDGRIREGITTPFSPTATIYPGNGGFADPESQGAFYLEGHADAQNDTGPTRQASTKVEQANFDAIWKQILDPVLEYCQVRGFVHHCSLALIVETQELCPLCSRSRPSSHPSPNNDSPYGRRHCRSSKTAVSPFRAGFICLPTTNVACFSKSHVRKCRVFKKACRRCK
jgi:Vps52 / Sac2 family